MLQKALKFIFAIGLSIMILSGAVWGTRFANWENKAQAITYEEHERIEHKAENSKKYIDMYAPVGLVTGIVLLIVGSSGFLIGRKLV